ncbi:type VI secretion system-associated protein TagO [Candidatus Venteria ishoeyi]|uniref:Type VI secretion-associated protein, VC_A0118 family n=1 Tax=Candidatus Venteria ishoeyi TaxID=1899563 RepID=A0A1H6FFB6_9GAMM|nr:type VI secretion system-associated protein TagO [Candidatus Venteria ishoeyi]SEH08111.1 Uncharacterised protein [Candidatus Venteria ishoeyi]
MKLKTLIILVLTALPGSSLADAVGDAAIILAAAYFECQKITDDSARLECLDNITISGSDSQPVPQISGENGKWTTSSRSNPVDDSTTVGLYLPADSGKSRLGKRVLLTIRCASNKTELYITWNDYLGSKSRVLTRIDDSKATTKKWDTSSDSVATFHPRGTIKFIKKLLQADKLVAKTTPYNESPIIAIFDTRKLSSVIGPLRETCHW